jgi:hypothetical protein
MIITYILGSQIIIWWVTRIHKYPHKLNIAIGIINFVVGICLPQFVPIEFSSKGTGITFMIVGIILFCLSIVTWIWVSASLITEGILGKRFRFFHIIDAIHCIM